MHASSKLQRQRGTRKMAQNMAWNTGMKLQKRTTKHHVNPPVGEK